MHSIREGWRLYYSDEGYPYYYNEITGESEWADISTVSDSNYHNTNNQLVEREGVDTEEEEEDSTQQGGKESELEDSKEEEEEEEGESATSTSESSFDDAFNEKFKAFLRTPAGIAAVMEEQERIAKYVEKKAQELEALSEEEYAKQLRASKEKDSSYGSSSVFNAVGVYLGITDSLPSRPDSDQKRSVDEQDALLTGNKDYNATMLGRTAKHRGVSNKMEKASNDDLEGGRRARADSRASSSSAGSSAEEDSLSSDDSDVEVINAPLFSELPSWLRPTELYENLVLPIHEYLHRRGILGSTVAMGGYIREKSYELAVIIGQQTVAATVTAGSALLRWTSLAWDNTMPYISHFMETVIDTPPSTNQSTSSSRKGKREKKRPKEEDRQEAVDHEGNSWDSLPPAPSPLDMNEINLEEGGDSTEIAQSTSRITVQMN